jgi:hypothetical protein
VRTLLNPGPALLEKVGPAVRLLCFGQPVAFGAGFDDVGFVGDAFDDLDRYPWDTAGCSDFLPGKEIPNELRNALFGADEASSGSSYRAVSRSVARQAALYESAEWIVPTCLGALVVGSSRIVKVALDLLQNLVFFESGFEARERGHGDIGRRVRDRARSGLAIYYSLLDHPDEAVRDESAGLIALLETDTLMLVHVLERIAREDQSEVVRRNAAALLAEQ